MIRLKSAGKTDVGLKREENEDNFIMLPDHGLYVLADGMGGHVGGKMASTLAVTLITEFIAARAVRPDFQFEYPPDESLPFSANVLVNAIKYANERIFIESCKNSEFEGMGTTCTAILTTDDDFVIAHVGDSRVYRLRDGELQQMTSDHSLLNHMLEIGEIRPEDSHKFANKNVILRAVGLKDYVEVTTHMEPKRVGDTYLMCSDGLSDLVEDPVIRDVLFNSESLPVACNQLVQLALRAGGKDNITVVTIEAEDATGEEHGWGTGTFTRKQNEARAAIYGGGGASVPPPGQGLPPGARGPGGPISPGRRTPRTGGFAAPGGVARPRTPQDGSPAPGLEPPPSSPSPRRPVTPSTGHAAMGPPPPRQQQRMGPPSPKRVNGERMHSVRTPLSTRRPAAPGPDGPPPPRRSDMPEPPRRAVNEMPAPPPRRRGGTPPQPAEPVAPEQPRSNPFASPAGRPSPMRPTSGGYAPPPGVVPQAQAAPRGPADYGPPPEASSTQRPNSGLFQAPPPGVFPQTTSEELPVVSSGESSVVGGPSRDTEEVPIVNRRTSDTVREVPVIARGQSVAELELEAEDSTKPTTLVPLITRDMKSGGAAAPARPARPSQSAAPARPSQSAAPGRPASGSSPRRDGQPGRAQSGEASVDVRHEYREQGSIMVDASLMTETQDDEESIVIDDSLLMEIDEPSESGRRPPPTPGKKRDGNNRPTELLPISGTRRKP